MKTKQPIRIYLADLYANGLEPKRGEKLYKTRSQVYTQSHSNAFGSHTSSSVSTTEEVYGKFYGNPTTMKKSKKTEHAIDKMSGPYPNQYYNNLVITKKDGWPSWAHNCYILRNVEIL